MQSYLFLKVAIYTRNAHDASYLMLQKVPLDLCFYVYVHDQASNNGSFN